MCEEARRSDALRWLPIFIYRTIPIYSRPPSFLPSLVQSLIHSFPRSFTHSCVHSFHSSTHSRRRHCLWGPAHLEDGTKQRITSYICLFPVLFFFVRLSVLLLFHIFLQPHQKKVKKLFLLVCIYTYYFRKENLNERFIQCRWGKKKRERFFVVPNFRLSDLTISNFFPTSYFC